MFAFRKIWIALFSWNFRFQIRPFALLLTSCSVYAQNVILIFYLLSRVIYLNLYLITKIKINHLIYYTGLPNFGTLIFFSENVSVFESIFQAKSKNDIHLIPPRLVFSAHVTSFFDKNIVLALDLLSCYPAVSFQADKKEWNLCVIILRDLHDAVVVIESHSEG